MSIAQEQALTDVLVEGGAHFELLPHRHTETARAEARALGLELDEVAKTVIVRTPNGYVRVVVPASGRVDLGKLRALLGTEGVEGVIRLATESELAAASRNARDRSGRSTRRRLLRLRAASAGAGRSRTARAD